VTDADGTEYVLTPNDELTFGRAEDCTLVIGRGDQGISRRAGQITFRAGGWWLVNASTKRPIEVIDAAVNRSTQLTVASASGDLDRCAIGGSPLEVVLMGAAPRPYGFRVRLVRPQRRAAADGGTGDASSTVLVELTDRQTEALVALAWGYLQPYPRHRPEPDSYKGVALRLGCSTARAQKLVDQVRLRMTAARLPGLDQNTSDARALVCRHALALRLVARDSCAWLERRLAARRGEGADESDPTETLELPDAGER
jgi:hypothetical protein